MAHLRTILHADMDAFYAAVEQRDHPELRGRPVIVGGLGKRGVVSTASYEAREYGVHSAMPITRARRLCPRGDYVTPRYEVYTAVSKQIQDVFRRFTPLVEPLSLDEAFLDVTGSVRLFGDGPTIAHEIRRLVFETTQLTISIGVASCKYVAKVASDVDKPDGLCIVAPGNEIDFLAPLPVARLWGAGPKTQEKLKHFGLHTIGDVQARSEADIIRLFGPTSGRHYHRISHADDDRPVVPFHDPKSIGHETTFGDDLLERRACHDVLFRLSEQVGRRLRRHKLRARTLRLKLRYSDFTTLSRQITVTPATDDDLAVFRHTRRLFDRTWKKGGPVRLLGVAGADLVDEDEERQLDLFTDNAEDPPRDRRLIETLDKIKNRFGDDSIGHGGANDV